MERDAGIPTSSMGLFLPGTHHEKGLRSLIQARPRSTGPRQCTF